MFYIFVKYKLLIYKINHHIIHIGVKHKATFESQCSIIVRAIIIYKNNNIICIKFRFLWGLFIMLIQLYWFGCYLKR